MGNGCLKIMRITSNIVMKVIGNVKNEYLVSVLNT